jgi:hypothetical protein
MIRDPRKPTVPLPANVIQEATLAIEAGANKSDWEGVKFQTFCSPGVFDWHHKPKKKWTKEQTDAHRRIKNARRWIEHFCRIRNKAGEISPIKLNAAQRKFLAKVMRRWRNGDPARVVILKPRQTGFSTVVELLIFYMTVTNTFRRGCVIAHKNQISTKILNMFHTALKFVPYDLSTKHRTRYEVVFGDPIASSVDVDSAESDEPGHGDTVQYLHLTEVSRWKDATRKAKGVMQTVPDLPMTLIVWESTANGAEGYFYELFNEAKDVENPANRMDAVFVAWYEHAEYTTTNASQEAIDQVMKTLTDEEEVLLQRKYFVRGEGWRQVSVEQLIWRRNTIVDKCGGSLDDFHEQYPSTDMEAFLSSGRPVFSPERLIDREEDTRKPVYRGDLFDPDFSPNEVPDSPGAMAQIESKPQMAGPMRRHIEKNRWPNKPTFEPEDGYEEESDSILKAFSDLAEQEPNRYGGDQDPEWS